jgi:hypothetical protein
MKGKEKWKHNEFLEKKMGFTYQNSTGLLSHFSVNSLPLKEGIYEF